MALWSAGFRPFFLAAAFSATVSLWYWLGGYLGYWTFPVAWPLKILHAHEMLFGFVGAAIAGFMLTAVPNWTQSKPLAGPKLIALFSVWLFARIGVWSAPWLPLEIIAAINLLFFPSLILAILPAIFASKQFKSMVFLVLLAAMFMSQTWTYAGIMGWIEHGSIHGLHLALFIICVIVVIISGRIIPNFTRNYLVTTFASSPVKSHPLANGLTIVSLLAYIGASMWFSTTNLLLAILSGALAISLLARCWHWAASSCLHNPILAILHIGHAWLPIGFGLLCANHLFPEISQQAGFHALTAGAMGTLIIAVMSRASLGHTGRELIADRITIIAYTLVVGGAVMRVVANLLSPSLLEISLGVGGILWALGFLLFGIRFLPILLSPRTQKSST